MQKNVISISIVIYHPNLNVLERVFVHLRQAMDYMIETGENCSFVLYVVDNGADLNTFENVKALLGKYFNPSQQIAYKFIKSGKNLGYGYANNLAIFDVDSNYHLVLNPDAYLEKDVFYKAVKYFDVNGEVGLLSADVVGEDGERHYLCKKHPTLFDMFLRSLAPGFIKKIFHKRIKNYEMRDHDYDKEIKNIPFPTGCFMFFRTHLLKQLNGFDPRFFLYYEDADIGRRLLEIAESRYVPDIKIVHKWARGTHTNSKLRWITVKSGLKYFFKWGGLF